MNLLPTLPTPTGQCYQVHSGSGLVSILLWLQQSTSASVASTLPSASEVFLPWALRWNGTDWCRDCGYGEHSTIQFSSVSFITHYLWVSVVAATHCNKELFLWSKLMSALIFGHKNNHLAGNVLRTLYPFSQRTAVAFPLWSVTFPDINFWPS